MSNVPLKDLKYSRFYVRSVYCSWKKNSDLNQNGCEIVRATVTPECCIDLETNCRLAWCHYCHYDVGERRYFENYFHSRQKISP